MSSSSNRRSSKSRSPSNGTAQEAPDEDKIGEFLSKTYMMVADPANQNVVSFLDGEDGFVVKDEKEFTTKLFEYFRHSNFSSFVRQLNFYGFSKRSTKHGANYFKRKYFNRRGDQLHLIKRKQSDGAATKTSARKLQEQIDELKQQYTHIISTQQRVVYILLTYLRGVGAIAPPHMQQQQQQLPHSGHDRNSVPLLGKRDARGSNKRPRLLTNQSLQTAVANYDGAYPPASPSATPDFPQIDWQDMSQLQSVIASLPMAQEILGSNLSSPRNFSNMNPGFPSNVRGSRHHPSDFGQDGDESIGENHPPLISPYPLQNGHSPQHQEWSADSPGADSDGVYEVDTGAWLASGKRAQKQMENAPDPNLLEDDFLSGFIHPASPSASSSSSSSMSRGPAHSSGGSSGASAVPSHPNRFFPGSPSVSPMQTHSSVHHTGFSSSADSHGNSSHASHDGFPSLHPSSSAAASSFQSVSPPFMTPSFAQTRQLDSPYSASAIAGEPPSPTTQLHSSAGDRQSSMADQESAAAKPDPGGVGNGDSFENFLS